MPNGDWNENDHVRDGKGRFVSAGTIWYVDESLADHAREHVAHERAHDQQHAAEQKAIDIAASTVRQWKEDANEWRQTFTDRDAAYAKVGEVGALDKRLRLIEEANIRREQGDQDRAQREARERGDADRRQSRQFQLLGFLLGIPALIGAVAGVIALVKG